jgi:hypothetical protein
MLPSFLSEFARQVVTQAKSYRLPSLSVCVYSPFNNPTETYRYYSLPFCHVHSTEEQEVEEAVEEDVDLETVNRVLERVEGAVRHRQRLGESIVGDRRESSPYEISFRDDVEWRLLCKEKIPPSALNKFKDAIHNNYVRSGHARPCDVCALSISLVL